MQLSYRYTDIRALKALQLPCVIEPHAVHSSDVVDETENNVTPDEVGPSGGAGGSGGSAAAAVLISAVWFQTSTIMADIKCASTDPLQTRNATIKTRSAHAE